MYLFLNYSNKKNSILLKTEKIQAFLLFKKKMITNTKQTLILNSIHTSLHSAEFKIVTKYLVSHELEQPGI